MHRCEYGLIIKKKFRRIKSCEYNVNAKYKINFKKLLRGDAVEMRKY